MVTVEYNDDMMIVRLGSVVLDFFARDVRADYAPSFSYFSDSTQYEYRLDDWQQQSLSILAFAWTAFAFVWNGMVGIVPLGKCIMYTAS